MAVDAEMAKLLFKIAVAYYEDGLTQEQIGRRLGLSRVKVSRLLRRAREERIVQISVAPPADSTVYLERRLEHKYALDEAVVVPTSSHDRTTVARELGPAAAECLVRSLAAYATKSSHQVLAMTWGSTLLSVVNALPSQNWPDVKVVQMLGGLGQPEADVYGADLVHRTARALGGRPRLVPAPGIVPSQLVRDALLSDPQITNTLALGAQADVALVGIGRPTPDSVVMQAGILDQEELNELKAHGAVGDIGLRFFDADGKLVEHDIYQRMIGLDLDQIRSIPRVIGVAGGEGKTEVIRAALRGRLVNVLITDDGTATRLVADEPL